MFVIHDLWFLRVGKMLEFWVSGDGYEINRISHELSGISESFPFIIE
jgi:hypothetical protein